MRFLERDVKFEPCKSRKKGGQRRDKTLTACRATHIPAGIQAKESWSYYHKSKKASLISLQKKVAEHFMRIVAAKRKEAWAKRIKETRTIRTYDFKRNTVTDHRTGKTACLKDFLRGGKLSDLQPKSQ